MIFALQHTILLALFLEIIDNLANTLGMLVRCRTQLPLLRPTNPTSSGAKTCVLPPNLSSHEKKDDGLFH